MLAVLALALSQAPAVPATLQPLPTELAPVFIRMLKRTPAFSPARGGVLQPDPKGFNDPESAAPYLWVLEYRWKEKGRLRTGTAMVLDAPAAAADRGLSDTDIAREFPVRDGSFALGSLTEDDTYEGWKARMVVARDRMIEAAAVAEVRTLISAQEVFRSVSGGVGYADAACLAKPLDCVPRAKPDAFVADVAALLSPEKGGYRRTFHPGARILARGTSARLLHTWAVTLTPTDPKRRAFCGDSTGVVCSFGGDSPLAAPSGACPVGCVAER